jgi:hypothetical protein
VRFYSLTISDPETGEVWTPSATSGVFVKGTGSGPSFSSQLPNGQYNPGALNIELDIPVTAWNTPQGKQFIRIWGVGLQMIGSAADLNGQNFLLQAGMTQGLAGPYGLANPKQAGVILQGSIFQAYGNWQGIDQTIDLICIQGTDLLIPPRGISFAWPPGTPLQDAITTALTQAFPGANYTITFNISSDLQSPYGAGQWACYASLDALSDYLQQITKPLGVQATGNADYPGVLIRFDGKTFFIFDETVPQTPIPLNFQDLIGQPTWMDFNIIQFKTVLRSDIKIGNQILFPQTANGQPAVIPPYALTTPSAAYPNAPARSKTTFQNTFTITEVHHFANFRQPDGDSWATAFTAAYPLTSGSQTGVPAP